MKRIFVIFLAAALLMCGCTRIEEPSEAAMAGIETEAEPQAYPVTVDTLTFNRAPEAVASLSPAITEIIFELGYGDTLVCRSSYCNYPEEAESVPEAGSGANPDIDRIISYAPDLLITQSPIANKDVKRLTDAGISLLTLNAPKDIDELCSCYEKLSLIFSGSIDGTAKAEAALSELKSSVEAAHNSCESIMLIMGITDDGFLVANTGTFAGNYTAAFGTNLAGADEYLFTAEELIAADPQVLFLAHPLKGKNIDSEISSQLRAFSEGHIFVIDSELMERPTSRLAEITQTIADTVREDTGGAGFSEGYAEIPEESTDSEESSENNSDADATNEDEFV